jgi:multidrug transporter EmrE-like cation transporter
MLAGLLVLVGNFFEELSASASKHAFTGRVFTYVLYGFLVESISVIFFGGTALIGGFSLAYNTHALPLFTLRVITEFLQCEVVFRALAIADRSTFGFIRVLTIPLLLLVDIMMGYTITNLQFLGIGIILVVLLAYFASGKIQGKGMGLALMSALLSVLDLTLYKYDITHYNVAAISQLYVALALFLIYGVRLVSSKEERSLLVQMKAHPLLGLVFVSQGFSSLLVSLAYQYAPASLILAFSRGVSVLWSLISGVFYFHEERVLKKTFAFALIILGLLVLVHR